VQDNPHRLAAEDLQQGGLQLMKKPGQLLTREQLKAQKVTVQLLAHLVLQSAAKLCAVSLSHRSDIFLDAKGARLSLECVMQGHA